ncbi:MAG: transglycosylase domain-containing protein [Chloroflexota bacterium]|nr:transglycosylase domain-containing protein [Chloroflexota bacterium]
MPTTLAQISPRVIACLLAIEDRRFWKHHGIDVVAVARAFVRDLRCGTFAEGGSTIGQQLLKNTILRGTPRLPRKVTELFLSPLTEALLGKPWVLQHYLNTVHMGGGVYGIRAAARVFLGRDCGDVSWSDAALLAGLPAAPERFRFYEENSLARPRRDFVLTRAGALGFLTASEVSVALREQLPRPFRIHPEVRHQLHELAPLIAAADGDSEIVTTIDRQMQMVAHHVVRSFARGASFRAIAAVDVATGGVRAVATRCSGADGRYDVAVGGRLSPGSVVKPFVLAVALELGYELTDEIESGPVTIADGGKYWFVENYDRSAHGRITLREATLLSDNTAYARLIASIGHELPAEVMAAAGLPSLPSPGYTLTLGVLQSGINAVTAAASYISLARGGESLSPTFDLRAVPVMHRLQIGHRPVASVVSVLRDVLRTRLTRGSCLEDAFGKTGTPDDDRSGWFVGVAGDLAVAAAIGEASSREEKARRAGELWLRFFDELHRVRPEVTKTS